MSHVHIRRRKRSRRIRFATACLIHLVSIGQVSAQASKSVVARHQRCVIESFARNAENAIDFDPALLENAVTQCEKVLEALKRSIMVRTHDSAFADLMVDKIRRASKRGTAVALLGLLDRQSVKPSAQVQNPGLLDQVDTPAKSATTGSGTGLLDEVDPSAGGVQKLRGKP